MTDFAVMDLPVESDNAFTEPLNLFRISSEKVHDKTESRFPSNAGERSELIDSIFKQF